MNPLDHPGAIAASLLAIIVATLNDGCSTMSIEADEIGEMWAFAEQHKTCDKPDTGQVRYVENVKERCLALGTPLYPVRGEITGISACTDGTFTYSILPVNPSAYLIAHEAAHRRFCDWHKGYAYFTSSEWNLIGARR